MAERELQDARIKLTVDDADLRETMRRIEGENRKTEGRRAAGGRNSNTLNTMRERAGSAFPSGLFAPVTALIPELNPLVQAGVTAGPVVVSEGRKMLPFVTGRGAMGKEEIAAAAVAAGGGRRKSMRKAAVAGVGLLALETLVPASVASGVNTPGVNALQFARLGARRIGTEVVTGFSAIGQAASIMAASSFVGQDLDIDTGRGLQTDLQVAAEAQSDITTSMNELRRGQMGKLIVQGMFEGGIELGVKALNATKEATGEAGTAIQRNLSNWWSKIRMPGTGYR